MEIRIFSNSILSSSDIFHCLLHITAEGNFYLPISKIRRSLSCDSPEFAAPVRIQSRLGVNEREVLLFMTTNKKQVLKRLLSLTLAVVMCFGFLPVPAQAASEATLTNGMPVTEENVLALIEEYRNGTREPGEKAKAAGFTSYADTKPTQRYDPYNPPYFGAIGSGTECAKFAFAFWDDIFGDAPYREVTDPWQVKPGDLIQYPSHWCIAVQSAYQRTGYDYPFTQAVGGGKTGSIGWGDPDASLNDILAIYTRYPIPYKFENSEVLLTAEGPIGTPLSSLDGLDSVRLEARKTN